jgi:hypothetical protein
MIYIPFAVGLIPIMAVMYMFLLLALISELVKFMWIRVGLANNA